MRISASLVLFHNKVEQYELAIKSYLDGCDGILYIMDNSAVPMNSDLFMHPRVFFLHFNKNLGFGCAHNRALALNLGMSDIHLFLNPDIAFNKAVLPYLVRVFQDSPGVGALMPKILFPDGSLQRLCKLLPSPLDLIFRRFIPIRLVRNFINKRYELYDLSQDKTSYVPSLSGCFLLVRTNLLHKVGGFDERYFMYMEDVDLIRRVGDLAKILYVPAVEVTHSYSKGSYRKNILLIYHLKSAILYFFKWGWFFDETRKKRNSDVLRSLKK
jgi:GT2 family glycosyltransferase